jgi:hypothetical protein
MKKSEQKKPKILIFFRKLSSQNLFINGKIRKPSQNFRNLSFQNVHINEENSDKKQNNLIFIIHKEVLRSKSSEIY